MLKPAWYLTTDADFFADTREEHRLPEAYKLLGELAERFGDDAGFSPAHTATAIHIAIVAIEHLGGASQYPEVSLGNRHELDRLLNGLNLLTAHLAQGFGHLRHRIGSGAIADLGDPDAVADITQCLARAGTACEIAAARLNDAHTILTGTSTTPNKK